MTTIPAQDPSDNGSNPQSSGVSYEVVNPNAATSVNPIGESVNTESTDSPLPVADRAVIHGYLSEVFAGVPGLLQVWTMPAKGRGRFFETTAAGINDAADWCVAAQSISGQQSVYARMTTLTAEPDPDTHGRGGADLCSHFLGLWTDIDFGTIGHKPGTKADSLPNPPDAGEAHRIYVEAGLPDASVLVNSGGGLYHVVLLAEPLDITDPELRGRIADMSRRWHRRVGAAAKRLGYDYGTGVHDVSRVLRVPGTVNSKDWEHQRPTSAMMSGARYTLEELEAFVPEPAAPVRNDEGMWVNPATGEILAEARHVGRPEDGTLRPGDDFNDRGDWYKDILNPAGFTYSHHAGQAEYWTRPGKDVRDGHSASLHWIPDRLWCWSAGDSGLMEQRAYDKFSAYSALWHGGNYSNAARSLAAQGYGTERDINLAPAPRPPEDMWAGMVDGRGQVTDAQGVAVADRELSAALADAVAPSADWTGLVVPSEDQGNEQITAKAGGNGSEGGDTPGGTSGDGDDGPPAEALPILFIENERSGKYEISRAIRTGKLPEIYVRDGKIVHVGVISGARNGRRGKKNAAPERQALDLNAHQLRDLIGTHLVTCKHSAKGEITEMLPTETLCKAVLARTDWEGVPDLSEITPMPFVRPDGTVCQRKGYDPETGIWLNVDDGFPEVPEEPTAEDVAAAKELLLDQVLHDFPFVTGADRANYLGLLLTPALGQVTGSLSPLGVITAANAGSGKTMLTEVISRTYGGSGDTTTLSRNDEEIRKSITSKLMGNSHKVVTFDNVGKTHTVDSPVLAELFTSPVWSDRLLGTNNDVSRVNDKLWLATGNNVRLGGDIADRSVFVRIDPKMEKPSKRDTTQFALGNLQVWLGLEGNREKIMHALLILIRSWAAAGMPKASMEMRTFTPWAQTVGGLLDHHGVYGFLTNTADVDDADDESYEWAQFLSMWNHHHGDQWMTTADLIASHKRAQFGVFSGETDPWQGAFPAKENSQPHTPHSLGAKLKHIQDRPFMGWVLRRTVNKTTNQRLWRAEPHGAPEPAPKPVYEQTAMDTEAPAQTAPVPVGPAPTGGGRPPSVPAQYTRETLDSGRDEPGEPPEPHRRQ